MGLIKKSKKTSVHSVREQQTGNSGFSLPNSVSRNLAQAFKSWQGQYGTSTSYIQDHVGFTLSDDRDSIDWRSDEVYNTRLDTISFNGTTDFYKTLDKDDYRNLIGMLVAYKETDLQKIIAPLGAQAVSVQNPKTVARQLFKCDELVIRTTRDPEGYYKTLSKLAYFHMVPQLLDKRLLSLDRSYALDMERLLLIVNHYHLPDDDNLNRYVKEEPFESAIYGEIVPDRNAPAGEPTQLKFSQLTQVANSHAMPLKYHGRNFIFNVLPELAPKTNQVASSQSKFSIGIFIRDAVISIICLNFFIGFVARFVTTYHLGLLQWLIAGVAGIALSLSFQRSALHKKNQDAS